MLGRARDWDWERLDSGPPQQANCVTPPLRLPTTSFVKGGIIPNQTRDMRRAGTFPFTVFIDF